MFYFCSTITAHFHDRTPMGKIIEITHGSTLLFGKAQEALAQKVAGCRTIVVTDENVARLHPALLAPFDCITIPAGEASKTLATAERIWRAFVEREIDRSSLVLGIGGGVVTDMAGFVAATYMRGLPFGFVPTTLLGMVDASVGGKNGVDLEGYKNLVGTFAQPRFVVCDIALLATLPDREFRAGLAEVVKAAIIGDTELFGLLEKVSFVELRKDNALLANVVERAVRVKADIVAADERENGERRKLNLGHTLAHAIEKVAPQYTHGEAVAIGLHRMAEAGCRMGLLGRDDAERIEALLDRYGFDTALPADMPSLCAAMRKDKKRAGGRLHLIVPAGIGSVCDCAMPLDEIEKLLY